jgi:hypothetical protein
MTENLQDQAGWSHVASAGGPAAANIRDLQSHFANVESALQQIERAVRLLKVESCLQRMEQALSNASLVPHFEVVGGGLPQRRIQGRAKLEAVWTGFATNVEGPRLAAVG